MQIMNQSDPAEGKEANLESDCTVFARKKYYSRALHHYRVFSLTWRASMQIY